MENIESPFLKNLEQREKQLLEKLIKNKQISNPVLRKDQEDKIIQQIKRISKQIEEERHKEKERSMQAQATEKTIESINVILDYASKKNGLGKTEKITQQPNKLFEKPSEQVDIMNAATIIVAGGIITTKQLIGTGAKLIKKEWTPYQEKLTATLNKLKENLKKRTKEESKTQPKDTGEKLKGENKAQLKDAEKKKMNLELDKWKKELDKKEKEIKKEFEKKNQEIKKNTEKQKEKIKKHLEEPEKSKKLKELKIVERKAQEELIKARRIELEKIKKEKEALKKAEIEAKKIADKIKKEEEIRKRREELERLRREQERMRKIQEQQKIR